MSEKDRVSWYTYEYGCGGQGVRYAREAEHGHLRLLKQRPVRQSIRIPLSSISFFSTNIIVVGISRKFVMAVCPHLLRRRGCWTLRVDRRLDWRRMGPGIMKELFPKGSEPNNDRAFESRQIAPFSSPIAYSQRGEVNLVFVM